MRGFVKICSSWQISVDPLHTYDMNKKYVFVQKNEKKR